MELPAILLLRAWLAEPLRAASGLLGIALVVWSVLPIVILPHPARRGAKGEFKAGVERLRVFFEDVEDAWRRNRIRAGGGILGIALFVWSAWPLATIR
jgi:hypothetical protein